MIDHLIQAITTTLKIELQGKKIPQKSWGTAPISGNTSLTLPYITLYPSQLQARQPPQQHSPKPPSDNLRVLTLTQDVQQDFAIDLYAKTAAALEEIASLVLGSLLTYHDQLIETYNTTKPKYQSHSVSTHHYLRQFQFLRGTPVYRPSAVGLQLAFRVTGHLVLTRPLTESLIPIHKVEIIPSPNLSLNGDPPQSMAKTRGPASS